jgi:hypothetical protein
MTTVQIDKLMEAISDIVGADGSYKDKVEKILGSCSEDEKTALFEFVSWFDEIEFGE